MLNLSTAVLTVAYLIIIIGASALSTSLIQHYENNNHKNPNHRHHSNTNQNHSNSNVRNNTYSHNNSHTNTYNNTNIVNNNNNNNNFDISADIKNHNSKKARKHNHSQTHKQSNSHSNNNNKNSTTHNKNNRNSKKRSKNKRYNNNNNNSSGRYPYRNSRNRKQTETFLKHKRGRQQQEEPRQRQQQSRRQLKQHKKQQQKQQPHYQVLFNEKLAVRAPELRYEGTVELVTSGKRRGLNNYFPVGNNKKTIRKRRNSEMKINKRNGLMDTEKFLVGDSNVHIGVFEDLIHSLLQLYTKRTANFGSEVRENEYPITVLQGVDYGRWQKHILQQLQLQQQQQLQQHKLSLPQQQHQHQKEQKLQKHQKQQKHPQRQKQKHQPQRQKQKQQQHHQQQQRQRLEKQLHQGGKRNCTKKVKSAAILPQLSSTPEPLSETASLQPLMEKSTKSHAETLLQFIHQLNKQPETSEEVLLSQNFERLANQPGISSDPMQHGSGFAKQYGPDHQTLPTYACKKIDSNFRLACPVYNENEDTTCIDDTQLCDGMADCPNGDDENKTVCMFYTMIRYTINKLTQTMFEKLQRH